MKFLKKSLLLQIVIAISLAITLGPYLPDSITRVFVTFNGLFGNFLGFIIPPLILGLIVPAIGNIGKEAGKLLLITTLIAYASTLFAGLTSYGVSIATFPHLLEGQHLISIGEEADYLPAYFEIQMPPFFDVMSALVMAFLLGISISRFEMPTLKSFFNEFRIFIMWVIEKLIVPFLPLFIFGIVLKITQSGQIAMVLGTFTKIIGIIFGLHIGIMILQYTIAGFFVKRNPFKLLKTMFPAYLTALGTQSSAATIPITLRQTIKNEVDPKIAGFTVPLCATIHLSGSTLKIVACAVALMLLQGQAVEPLTMFGFIALLGIAMVAAPGVPGGAIMAALGVLSSVLGFDADSQSLMIALYIAMDSFGTACNVMGDGAIALIMDKINMRSQVKMS